MSSNVSKEHDTTYVDNNGNEYKWACCQDTTLPTTEAIGCDGINSDDKPCIYWTHFKCAGFNHDMINRLQNDETEITYYCKHCKKLNEDSKENKLGTDISNGDKATCTNENKNPNKTTTGSTVETVASIEMRWVQCDKCLKWRRIPTSVPKGEFEGKWTCSMNKWDLKRSSCLTKEEAYDPTQEETIQISETTNGDYDAQDVPMLEFITSNHSNHSNNGQKKKKKKKKKKEKKPPGYKRLTKEIQSLILNPPPGIGACPICNDDLLHWFATIDGPQNTPYFGYRFYLNIDFGEHYPFEPPKVVFKTKIYHCNINTKNGEICLDILKDSYSPALTVEKILLSVSALLQVPNPEDPLVPDIARLLITNKDLHDETAREWTKRYATEINKQNEC